MNLGLIALMLVAGAVSLGVVTWRLSVWAWAHRPDERSDIAPRTQLPSLYELRGRRDRR